MDDLSITIEFSEPEARFLGALVKEILLNTEFTVRQNVLLHSIAQKFIAAGDSAREQLIQEHGITGAMKIAEEYIDADPDIDVVRL